MNWTPWRRNQDTSSVPAEVQDYYQSERRERVGVAWLLAVGTLLATLAVVIALFFGGRWVWNKIAGNDDKKTPTTSQQQTEQDAEKGAGQVSTPSGTGSPSTGTSSTSTSTPSGSTTAPAAGQTPPTPGLVNTGPGDESGM